MSKVEKERHVIDLYYNQGKTTREIVKGISVSPNYLSEILKKKKRRIVSLLVTRNNLILHYLPKHTNYFLKVRHMLKSLLH